MDAYIKKLIELNEMANENIGSLESTISNFPIVENNDKDKANFGNLCIALKGFRMVAESTEAMLENENVVRGIDGFYEKVNLTTNKPSKPQESENNDTNK